MTRWKEARGGEGRGGDEEARGGQKCLVSKIMKHSMTRPYQPNGKKKITLSSKGVLNARPFLARYLEPHGGISTERQ